VYALLMTVHVLAAVVLILIILLQSARGTDIAGAFGGMGSQAAFGPRGTATFLSKATAVLAVVFMLTSLSLAILSNRVRSGGSSVLGESEAATETAPAAPPAQTPAAPPVNTEVIPATPAPPEAPAPPSQ